MSWFGQHSDRFYIVVFLLAQIFNPSRVQAQQGEDDPNLGKLRPEISYCAHKLIPGLDVPSPLQTFLDEIKNQVADPEFTEEEVYQVIKKGFTEEYFRIKPSRKPPQTSDEESDPMLVGKEEVIYDLPPLISHWSEILRLDDCLDFLRNVGIPSSEWSQKCIDLKIPKTLSDLKSRIVLKDELSLLKYLQQSDHKTSRLNGVLQSHIWDQFKKDLVIGHFAQASQRNYEKKAAQFYRHFVSEIPVARAYWQPSHARKKIDPNDLNHTLWNITSIIPAYPSYLSQQLIIDESGIKGQNGERKQLQIGKYDRGDSTNPFTGSKLLNWTQKGSTQSPESLSYNPGPNGKSDLDTLSLSVYARMDGPVLIPMKSTATSFNSAFDVIEFTCFMVGDPLRKLICLGKTNTATKPGQPYSQSMKGENGFILVLTRDRSI